MSFTQIPIVDLSQHSQKSGSTPQALGEHLVQICHEVGFFVLTGHGLDPALLKTVELQARALFQLPQTIKQRIDKRHSRHFRGWEPVGTEFTNGRPDIREQVDLWSEHAPRAASVQPNYWRLLGPNQWLSETELPGFRVALEQWFDALGGLADELMSLLSRGLGLAPDAFETRFGQERMSLTKLICYPATPPGDFGVNAHHDTGFLTLVAPGAVAGLQVQAPAGDWIDVPNIPGALVVNLGEMLQAITGNYLLATPHRVVTQEPRLSLAYFHGPGLDTPLVRLPLAQRFQDKVSASERHTKAGFMARRDETAQGVADMQSSYQAEVYGEQLWNYFERSYPKHVTQHYGAKPLT